jgi:hypothetical protein
MAHATTAEPEPLGASDVLRTFIGLDRPSSTDQGFVFFPPDTIVGKSNTRVIEMTNSAIRLFNSVGGVIATSGLTPFFGAAAADGIVFDPRVYFDRNASNRRFVALAVQRSATVSRLLIAVSRSSDPANLLAGSWCRYSVDARRDVGTANASWADYPQLGASANAFLISDNQFRFSNNTFTFAIVRAFNKLIAYNNAGGCPAIPFFTFQPSGVIGTGTVFTLHPVQHYTSPSSFAGASNPAYLTSTIFGASNQYRIWRIRNLFSAVAPTIQVVNVAGAFFYGVQPDAPQTGTAVLIDTGDNRVTQSAGIGNLLWAVHGTLCNVGGGATESCVRYARVSVGQNVFGFPTAVLSGFPETATFGFPNEFYFWPGVAANTQLQIGVPFQFISRTLTAGRLSAWWTTKDPGSTPGAVNALTTGTCPQTISNRSGDYVGAQTDPLNLRHFWFAGERATLIRGVCQWQTAIQQIEPGFIVTTFNPTTQ